MSYILFSWSKQAESVCKRYILCASLEAHRKSTYCKEYNKINSGGQANFFLKSVNLKSANSWRKFLRCASPHIVNPQICITYPQKSTKYFTNSVSK